MFSSENSWLVLDKRYRVVSFIEHSLLGAFLCGVSILCSTFVTAEFSPTLSIISGLLSTYLPALWAFWLIYHWFADGKKRYFVDEVEVSLFSGWFAPSLSTVPFKRVQHIELKQGVIDRLFSLHKVVILSAGKGLTVPGISFKDASELRAEILKGVDQENE